MINDQDRSVSRINAPLFPLLCLAGLASCSHYYVPATHLASSEIGGERRVLEIQPIRLQGGTRFTQAQKVAEKTFLQFGAQTFFPVTPKIEAGLQIQPYAPLMVLGKTQVIGRTDSDPIAENFVDKISVSLQGGPGFLLGSGGVNVFAFDLCTPTGFRLGEKNLVMLVPFFNTASLNGSVSQGSISQYGIGLAHQLESESILLRTEIMNVNGSNENSEISGYLLGIGLGLKLEREPN